ncbi:MAG: substrate-binding domain-containing protein [Sedimentisphaerales bacterium]|nr:substrate-binding domain-containing protein [Sedimentisphaerales bacterium]
MRRLIIAIVVITAVTLTGCDGEKSKKEPSAEKELLLYCGAGIRPPAAELAETFGRENGVKIITDYAGSEVLMSKIKLMQRGDLYMPGDKYYVNLAAEKGLILSQKSVCYFVPTILVQKGNPKNISGLEDLLKPGLKLGLGDEKACAIGRKCKKIFAKNNIQWADVEKNLKFQSLTVNELGMQIQAQALDVVIVWDAVARYYSKYGEEISIPVEKNVISTVDIGVLKFTRNKELAEKFVEFTVSEQGQAIFRKHLYSVESPL